MNQGSKVSTPQVQLAQLIIDSGRFQVKNEFTAMRVARALDRYIFSITPPYNDAERVCDKIACFNDSGLSALLAELTVKEAAISDAEKLKILLSLQAQAIATLSTLTTLSERDNREWAQILELGKSTNPIPTYSSIKELVFIIFFIFIAAMAVLANLK